MQRRKLLKDLFPAFQNGDFMPVIAQILRVFVGDEAPDFLGQVIGGVRKRLALLLAQPPAALHFHLVLHALVDGPHFPNREQYGQNAQNEQNDEKRTHSAASPLEPFALEIIA